MIKIYVTSVLVDDQEKALKFYTEKLGFVKKTEVPMGEHKWLTVVSPDELNGVERVLEPMAFEPAKVYQKALKDAGIPLTAFMVEDLLKEYDRLTSAGVKFSIEPKTMGPVMIAVLDDTFWEQHSTGSNALMNKNTYANGQKTSEQAGDQPTTTGFGYFGKDFPIILWANSWTWTGALL